MYRPFLFPRSGPAVVARRSALPRRCGGSPYEIREGDVEGVGEEQQVFQVGDAVGVLPAVDRPMLPTDFLAELGLGEIGAEAGGA